jgi:predicted  nucleic acid-binding Zn-ribbon protein
MSKIEELKAISEEKKALTARQKALREELKATKGDRKAARKVRAESRQAVLTQKAVLRGLNASIYEAFSEGDSESIGELADSIMEVATALATSVRNFAEAADT